MSWLVSEGGVVTLSALGLPRQFPARDDLPERHAAGPALGGGTPT
jgi:hypothetical protein